MHLNEENREFGNMQELERMSRVPADGCSLQCVVSVLRLFSVDVLFATW